MREEGWWAQLWPLNGLCSPAFPFGGPCQAVLSKAYSNPLDLCSCRARGRDTEGGTLSVSTRWMEAGGDACPPGHPGLERVGEPGDWHPPSFLPGLPLPLIPDIPRLAPPLVSRLSLGSPGFPETSGPRARKAFPWTVLPPPGRAPLCPPCQPATAATAVIVRCIPGSDLTWTN